MHFVHTAEEVVEIAHDVLVGTGEEEADIVRLAGLPAVEREGFLHILDVDELRDLAVRVAGDIHERGVAVRRFVQTLDRHDGEKLAQRPVVEEGLENGEVAEVLVPEGILDFLNLLGQGLGFVEKLHGARGDLPIDGLDARLRAKIEQTEVEHRLRALADFLGIVEILEAAIH